MTPEVKKTGRYENREQFKFWSGEARDNFVTIRFGNIGTSGHCSSKEFPSQDAAKEFLENRLEAKVDEGYELVEPEDSD